MMTKIKIWTTIIVVAVVAAIGFQVLNPGPDGPERKGPGKQELYLSVTHRPAVLPADDVPLDIDVTVSTGAEYHWHVRAQWVGITLYLSPGQTVVLSASRYTIRYLECKIFLGDKQVSYDNHYADGIVMCVYVATGVGIR